MFLCGHEQGAIKSEWKVIDVINIFSFPCNYNNNLSHRPHHHHTVNSLLINAEISPCHHSRDPPGSSHINNDWTPQQRARRVHKKTLKPTYDDTRSQYISSKAAVTATKRRMGWHEPSTHDEQLVSITQQLHGRQRSRDLSFLKWRGGSTGAVHCEKSYYTAGEQMWLSLCLRDKPTLEKTEISGMLWRSFLGLVWWHISAPDFKAADIGMQQLKSLQLK